MDEAIIAGGSAWSAARIAQYLGETVLPCRLSCITGDGFPHVMSLWFHFADDALWFSVQESAWMARWLADDPRCGFELAGNNPPYSGVRGRGMARVLRGREHTVLPGLLDRFLGGRDSDLARWLLSRLDTEVTIRVEPRWMTSWDYGERMDET